MIATILVSVFATVVVTGVGFLAGYVFRSLAADSELDLAIQLAEGEGHEAGYNQALEEIINQQEKIEAVNKEQALRVEQMIQNLYPEARAEEDEIGDFPDLNKKDKDLLN